MIKAKSLPKSSLYLQTEASDPSDQAVAVYHLSHDLRGPLNSILGFSDLLLEGVEGPLNEVQLEDIAAIRQSALNLLDLINVVVDLSKISANKLSLNWSQVPLERLAQQVTEHDLGEGRRGSWANRQTLPTMQGDYERIEQILLILARFLFEHKAGQVQLEVEPDGAEINLKLTAPGVVLDKQTIAELPNLSIVTDGNGRSKLSAGGVRVPLAYQLAKQHRGQIWVESQPDSGATFCLRLPVSQ
ncbi:MAG TPA: HAMP domain-containing sensor histidine kinase [Anaerolineae bacterium]|nr:HAMP domain-containing sensor histidine kinase [Anaerolineae bacterium]